MSLAEECLWSIECIKARVIQEIRQLPASRGMLMRHLGELPASILSDVGSELTENDIRSLMSLEVNDKIIALIAGVNPGKINSIELVIRLSELMMEHNELSGALRLLKSKVNAVEGKEAVRLKALMELCEGLINIKSLELKHESGEHDAEHELIDEAMTHLSAAYRYYEELGELNDAINVRLMSLIELAKYHLAHGDLDSAKSAYLQCSSLVRWSNEYVTEATRCAAMAKLIEAIESGELSHYEEAGDMLLNIADETPEAAEEAEAAYGSALQLASNDEDKGRLFIKYLTALVLHIDSLSNQKYGGFNGMVNAIKTMGLGHVATELGISEDKVRLYLSIKALAKVGGFEGVKAAAFLTALGLNLVSTSEADLVGKLREAGINIGINELKEAKAILSSWLGP